MTDFILFLSPRLSACVQSHTCVTDFILFLSAGLSVFELLHVVLLYNHCLQPIFLKFSIMVGDGHRIGIGWL